MELNNSSKTPGNKPLSPIYKFHTLMEENDIMLVYCGEFSQDLNKTLLSFIERKFKADNVEDNTRRKIFNIMVEVLQNISKNKVEKGNDVDLPETETIFILGANTESYIVISSNLIKNEKISSLKGRIDQVNELDKEGLKQLYKDIRMNSAFSEKAGAGIGIIDIARKSENKIEYMFEYLNDVYSIFSLLIRITK